jgi:hypothetical protein
MLVVEFGPEQGDKPVPATESRWREGEVDEQRQSFGLDGDRYDSGTATGCQTD